MGKSLGNFITLPELFAGKHEKLAQAYTPMTVRFFILQAHYRGTLDFSNEALQAAEKGLKRIMQAAKDLRTLASAAGVQAAPALAYGEFVSATAPSEITASNAEVKASAAIDTATQNGVTAALANAAETTLASAADANAANGATAKTVTVTVSGNPTADNFKVGTITVTLATAD